MHSEPHLNWGFLCMCSYPVTQFQLQFTKLLCTFRKLISAVIVPLAEISDGWCSSTAVHKHPLCASLGLVSGKTYWHQCVVWRVWAVEVTGDWALQTTFISMLTFLTLEQHNSNVKHAKADAYFLTYFLLFPNSCIFSHLYAYQTLRASVTVMSLIHHLFSSQQKWRVSP